MKQLQNWEDLELPVVPFVSFKKIFDNWESWATDDNHPRQIEAQQLLNRVGGIEELQTPFRDLSLLEKYSEEIALLLSDIFPESLQENEIKTASIPFQPFFFNATTRFKSILENATEGFQLEMRGVDADYFYIVSAAFYLKLKYGAPIDLSQPKLYDIPDKRTGIMHTYRAFFNADFSTIIPREGTPELSPAQVDELLGNTEDIDLWKKLIPPHSFEFHGLGLMTLFDMTQDEALSQLKTLLIGPQALMDATELEKLERSLATYLGVGDLRFGLAVLRNGDLVSTPEKQWSSVLLGEEKCMDCDSAFCSYTHELLLKNSKPLLITDVDHHKDSPAPIMKKMIEAGAKSFITAPLVYDGKVIGLLEVRSEQARVINSVSEQKLREVTALFSIALNRAIEEYQNQVEAVIKEKCTAVHPSVEWRFFQAANNLLAQDQNFHELEMEPIVFDRVVPLFGQLDIKGSSTYRNRSIKADLVTQLRLARAVFVEAFKHEPMLMYEQFMLEIDTNLDRLTDRLGAAEENIVTGLFRRTISPALDHLRHTQSNLQALKEYDQRLDHKLGVIYEERKSYEDTVAAINEHIGSYIEGAQRKAQSIFPHYFEKYRTDGVEYNMYIGQSLVDGKVYNDIYLKNLRLWQLVVTCEVENLMHKVKDTLALPLEVASLIMVQDTPLDIRFRYDEKRFDVDGAYNARYEIIKKRIDKAHLRGTNERLTQPGKIAIVFSSAGERAEYERYIQYLLELEYITENVEYVELEDLAGANGLLALRLEINYESKKLDEYLSEKMVKIMDSVSS